MRTILFIAIFGLFFSCSRESNDIHVDDLVYNKRSKPPLVIILFGQSNADGTGIRSEIKDERLYNIDLEDSIKIYNNGWENISFDNNTYNKNFDFGLEVSLAMKLKDSLHREIRIIKFAVGGSCLFDHETRPNWNVNTKGLFHYFTDLVNEALSTLPEYEIYKSIYYQGETDTYELEWANAYEDNLSDLISETKRLTPIKEITIVRIQDEYSSKIGYSIVRGVQEKYDYVNTDDLELNNVGNPRHISGAGLIKLGSML